MLFKTTIAGVNLDGYIYNASGPDCTIMDELELIGNSDSAAIMMKSCTLEPRDGNPEPRYKEVALGSINSMGLPNLGYDKYLGFASELKKYNKPVVASVIGMHPDHFPIIVKAFQESGQADLIEVNLSCPNVIGEPQIGYEFETADRVLGEVTGLGDIPIGVKLPPYFDLAHYDKIAAILLKHKVSFITCINSVGNTLIVDPETEKALIKPKGGFGGLGGKYIKPVALANVRRFYELIGDKVDIIGCGGIVNGVDVFEHLLVGASAVQIGTQFAMEGPACFARLNKEFEEYMEKKGYKSIEEVKGNLKTIDD